MDEHRIRRSSASRRRARQDHSQSRHSTASERRSHSHTRRASQDSDNFVEVGLRRDRERDRDREREREREPKSNKSFGCGDEDDNYSLLVMPDASNTAYGRTGHRDLWRDTGSSSQAPCCSTHAPGHTMDSQETMRHRRLWLYFVKKPAHGRYAPILDKSGRPLEHSYAKSVRRHQLWQRPGQAHSECLLPPRQCTEDDLNMMDETLAQTTAVGGFYEEEHGLTERNQTERYSQITDNNISRGSKRQAYGESVNNVARRPEYMEDDLLANETLSDMQRELEEFERQLESISSDTDEALWRQQLRHPTKDSPQQRSRSPPSPPQPPSPLPPPKQPNSPPKAQWSSPMEDYHPPVKPRTSLQHQRPPPGPPKLYPRNNKNVPSPRNNYVNAGQRRQAPCTGTPLDNGDYNLPESDEFSSGDEAQWLRVPVADNMGGPPTHLIHSPSAMTLGSSSFTSLEEFPPPVAPAPAPVTSSPRIRMPAAPAALNTSNEAVSADRDRDRDPVSISQLTQITANSCYTYTQQQSVRTATIANQSHNASAITMSARSRRSRNDDSGHSKCSPSPSRSRLPILKNPLVPRPNEPRERQSRISQTQPKSLSSSTASNYRSASVNAPKLGRRRSPSYDSKPVSVSQKSSYHTPSPQSQQTTPYWKQRQQSNRVPVSPQQYANSPKRASFRDSSSPGDLDRRMRSLSFRDRSPSVPSPQQQQTPPSYSADRDILRRHFGAEEVNRSPLQAAAPSPIRQNRSSSSQLPRTPTGAQPSPNGDQVTARLLVEDTVGAQAALLTRTDPRAGSILRRNKCAARLLPTPRRVGQRQACAVSITAASEEHLHRCASELDHIYPQWQVCHQIG